MLKQLKFCTPFVLLAVLNLLIPSEAQFRVEGGSTIKTNAAPYIAALMEPTGAYCAGTIISHYVIVTAAHCLDLRKPVQVRIGSALNHEGGDVYDVKETILHENYSSPHEVDATYDYGVVILKEPILTKGVVFAKLYEKDLPTGTMVTLSGWGDGIDLKQAKIPIYNMTECINNYGYIPLTVDPTVMLCAGFRSGEITSCRGDSGGPLIYKKRLLVGIVSWGTNDCTTNSFPGVYARVSTMIGWFKNIADKHQYVKKERKSLR